MLDGGLVVVGFIPLENLVQVKAPGIETQAAYRVWMLSLPPGALVRQGLLLNVELIDLARAAGQQASGSSCLHDPNTGMTGTCYCAWCFTWVLGTTTKVLVTVWQLNHLLIPLPQLSPPQPSTPNIISASPVCFKFYLDMTENIHFVCVHEYVCVSLLSTFCFEDPARELPMEPHPISFLGGNKSLRRKR